MNQSIKKLLAEAIEDARPYFEGAEDVLSDTSLSDIEAVERVDGLLKNVHMAALSHLGPALTKAKSLDPCAEH